MNTDPVDEVSARKFLLGDLSPEERHVIEERAFLDPDNFALLQAAEDDLIDEYLSGDLTPDEAERFTNFFMREPGRAADLRIAQALQEYGARPPLPSSVGTSERAGPVDKTSIQAWLNFRGSGFRLAFAFTVLLIAVGAIWLAFRILRRQNSPTPIEAHQEKVKETPGPPDKVVTPPGDSDNSRGIEVVQTKPPVTPQHPPPHTYSFVLIPVGSVRSESNSTTLTLFSTSDIFNLELPLIEEDSYRSYRATLKNKSGAEVHVWTNLSVRKLQSGNGIQISVPAKLLERQQSYQFILTGRTLDGRFREIGTYPFAVVNGK